MTAEHLAPPKIYWGLESLIGQLSQTLQNELRLASFPTLSDERILFGKAALSSRRAPPSIVAIQVPSGATGMIYGKENVSPESNLAQPVLNSLATELLRIDFLCWGASASPDPDGLRDADACRMLYSQLWRVIHRGAEGSYRVLGVTPVSDPATASGYQAWLHVELSTPVLDNLQAYVPPGLLATITVENESAEVAAVIPLPGVP